MDYMDRKTETVSIINYFFQADKAYTDKYLKEYLSIGSKYRDKKMSCKDFHKLKLGKQTYCQFLSEYNHVWEYSNYRVYVSSKGMTLEVLPSLTLNEVKDAWNDYYNKMMKD